MERLRVQEAARLRIKVTEQQVLAYLARVERQRGLPRGGFIANLKRARIDPRTVIAQIHAGLAWNQVITRRIAPRIRITPAEIEEVLARMQADKNRVQYRLREIYLPVGASDREPAVLRTAQQIMNQLRRGAPFPALARQFSGSGTAAVGGDRGLVFEAQLEPELLAAVRKMRPGQIIGPVRTITGYYIVQLISRGTLARGNTGVTTISVANVGYRYRTAAERAKAKPRHGEDRARRQVVPGDHGGCPPERRQHHPLEPERPPRPDARPRPRHYYPPESGSEIAGHPHAAGRDGVHALQEGEAQPADPRRDPPQPAAAEGQHAVAELPARSAPGGDHRNPRLGRR